MLCVSLQIPMEVRADMSVPTSSPPTWACEGELRKQEHILNRLVLRGGIRCSGRFDEARSDASECFDEENE